jgi:hypothetical protein
MDSRWFPERIKKEYHKQDEYYPNDKPILPFHAPDLFLQNKQILKRVRL